MGFVRQGFVAIILITLTLVLQSAGMAALIQWAKARIAIGIHRLDSLRSAVLMVRFTSLLVCLHVLEILLWAQFYRWKCFATWESAFYFSAASYSTLGSGDLLLQPTWRTMGPVESVTGALMCGLSASFLFAIVTRLVERVEPELADRLADSASTLPLDQTARLAAQAVDDTGRNGSQCQESPPMGSNDKKNQTM